MYTLWKLIDKIVYEKDFFFINMCIAQLDWSKKSYAA